MSHLEPVPDRLMRVLRPIGYALLASQVAFPAALLLSVAFGPFGRSMFGAVMLVLTVPVTYGFMVFSRHRREKQARLRAQGQAGPPRGRSMLAAGFCAIALGIVTLAILAGPGSEKSGRVLYAASVFLCAGTGAVVLGLRRMRARRAWEHDGGPGTR